MDSRLKAVVEKMFDRCYQDSEYKQVLFTVLHSTITKGVWQVYQTLDMEADLTFVQT